MKYSKGSKVEVLNTHEVPSGSWRCAEVVTSKRYYITVKYDMDATDKLMLENVARNRVRPCPPPVVHPQNWIPGDVIEVMHIFSWKMATVSKVLKKNCFMVRLVGSSTEFMVHEVNTRSRLSWLDEKWVLVGRGSGDQKARECNERSVVNYHWLSSSQSKGIKRNVNSGEENDVFKNEENVFIQEPFIVLPKTLKRRSPDCSHVRTHEGMQKYRLIEKDGGYDRVIAGDPYCMLEKVHPSAYTRKVGGGNEACSRVGDGNMVSMSHEEMLEIKDEVGKLSARRIEHDDPDTSSVGSCSITTPYSLHSRVLAFPADNADDHSSDAESTYQSRDDDDVNCLISGGEELTTEIHRLELHAYRRTMEALYALGPLSWEQESLITNLRISLHITNDEHLTELRSLTSNAKSISVR